jgi:hypothetical protein
MVNHVWTVLCSRAVIDRESNNVSLLEVVEQINAIREPIAPATPGELAALPVQMEVVSLWERSNLDLGGVNEGRIELVGPNGESLAEAMFRIDVTAHARQRVQLKIAGLPITGSGRYYIYTFHRSNEGQEWQRVSQTPLQVELQTALPNQPAAT